MLGPPPDIYTSALTNTLFCGREALEQHDLLKTDLVDKQFSVLKKCRSKFDCLIFEVLFIKELNPELNTQKDSRKILWVTLNANTLFICIVLRSYSSLLEFFFTFIFVRRIFKLLTIASHRKPGPLVDTTDKEGSVVKKKIKFVSATFSKSN